MQNARARGIVRGSNVDIDIARSDYGHRKGFGTTDEYSSENHRQKSQTNTTLDNRKGSKGPTFALKYRAGTEAPMKHSQSSLTEIES